MKRPISIVRHEYDESGQSAVDQLSEILHTHNPATTLSFDSEQKCLHITGLPDMDDSECVRILSQFQSDTWILVFEEKTAQGIIIIKLVRRLSERDLDRIQRAFARSEHDSRSERDRQIEHESARSGHNFRSALDNRRSLNALRAKMQQIRNRQ